MNTWIEMSNLREREWALKIEEHPRLVIQEIEKEITRCSQCLIIIIWGGATLASITLMMTAIFCKQPTHPSVRPLPYLRYSRFSLLTRADEDVWRLFSDHQCHHPPRKPDSDPIYPTRIRPYWSCGRKRRNEPRTKNRSLYKIATVAGSGNQYPAR